MAIGNSVIVEDKELQVSSMDAELIKQVKVVEAVRRDKVAYLIAE